MDRSTRRRVAIGILAFVVAAALAVVVAPSGSTLVVEDADTGERLLEIPVEDGDEVTLSYTHSVEKTPIEDVYVVDGTELRMDRMVFRSYGAGLPANKPIERTDDGFVVYSDDSYEELGVVPAPIAEHELVVGDERYDLVEQSDGPVVITVTDATRIDTVSTLEYEVSGNIHAAI
ncbi:DUF1850 domain-containing protein [Natronobacterium texcoconense]|uniref:DUF1850 domain-containing protein n=1 Tax=Natronobacterium texcoconense TaxID=1095778 RepID=A0A1H1J0S7_NATTX|nr:DUF1850 domain-containing protein [Natronobacterium texcoconense]SDR43584.1 hypothetical protein SAMN04489842_3979 [Natronobacterium texcoconense]